MYGPNNYKFHYQCTLAHFLMIRDQSNCCCRTLKFMVLAYRSLHAAVLLLRNAKGLMKTCAIYSSHPWGPQWGKIIQFSAHRLFFGLGKMCSR